jgi:membrane-bound ClpP family serine protease
MFPATQRRGRPDAWRGGLCLAGILLLGMLTSPTWAQPAPRPDNDGLFLTVPNPITEDAVSDIEFKIKDALAQHRRIRDLVFDFNPGGAPSGNSKAPSCIALADYLLELRLGGLNLNTFAFVHNDVTGHTVLPVLACGELYMSDRGRLGDVLRDAPRLTPSTVAAYENVAKKCPAGDLVLKLIKPELEIHKIKMRGGSLWYLSRDKLDVLRQQKDQGGVLADEGVLPGLEGRNLMFSARQARDFGLCKGLFETREDVRRALNLPTRSLEEDFFAGKTRVAWRIEVRGSINKAKLDSLDRRIKHAIAQNANLLILQLEAEGGETVDAPSFAQGLRTLRDNSGNLPVTTVAYVPPGRELGAATFLALGCSRIFMGENAKLGNFEYLKGESPELLKAKRDMLVSLAEERGYPAELFRAMLDASTILYRVHRKTDPGVTLIVSEAELQRDATSKSPQWVEAGHIARTPGEFFKLDTDLTSELGVATRGNLEAVYQAYKLDPAQVRVARDDWLDKVAEFFRQPLVNVLLVMIGIAGLILELKMPGVAVPGIVAAVCFVLFFWAHSFVGQFTMLAVLLFVLGLILIGLEIFVLPGFGVTGISGIVLVVASLALVTLERMPETTQDWMGLGARLSVFGVSLMAAIVAAFMLAWYLPHLPYASRLVLAPPGHEEEGETSTSVERYAALLGAIGVAATTLRPSGKARFGDDFLDVVAEGDFIDPGSRVQIIEIEGNRIVVKEV